MMSNNPMQDEEAHHIAHVVRHERFWYPSAILE
jgi:hypothetical protein